MGWLPPLWTDAQDKALQRYAALGISRTVAAERLGRSYDGTVKRARLLGVKFKDHPRFQPWTEEEDARLYALLAEGATMYEASAVLKRGAHGCRFHANKLGWRFMTPEQRAVVRPGFHGRSKSDWSQATVEQAKTWWRERKSARWIGDQLGVSRNAVIGMMHRRLRNDPNRKKPQHKLEQQAQAKRNRHARKACTTVGATPKKPPLVVFSVRPARDIARISHDELQSKHCRWPVGEASEAVANHAPLYCGQPRVAGLPYCEVHCLRAFLRIPASPRQSYPVPGLM